MSGFSFNPYTALSQVKLGSVTGPAERPDVKSNPLTEGIADFRVALQQAEQVALQTAISGADPHAMVQALTNAEMTLNAVVTIRDKVVEAYQELLRMPV